MRERAAWYWDKRGVRGDRKESELGMASTLLAQLELRGKVRLYDLAGSVEPVRCLSLFLGAEGTSRWRGVRPGSRPGC